MPGDRLTRPDRRHIAAGLAAGLSYSEIAKRLGRPTSTVTREVMRNEGPQGYRADRAHAAAQQRARRGRSTVGPPPRAAANRVAAPRDIRAFQERLGGLFVDRGMARMPARVLACLYTSDGASLTAAELVRHLQVSPAAVSKAVCYLEGQELVRRERDAGERRDRYFVDDDVWFRAILAGTRMNAVLSETAHEGAELVGRDTPAGRRLDGMSRLLDHIGGGLVRAAEEWRRANGPKLSDAGRPRGSGAPARG